MSEQTAPSRRPRALLPGAHHAVIPAGRKPGSSALCNPLARREAGEGGLPAKASVAGGEGTAQLSDRWEDVRLADICDVIQGQSPPGSTYNTNGKGLPFFQGKAEFGDLYPTPAKWCTAPKKIAEPGDILVSIRAPVGPTNLCQQKACIGRGLAAIRPHNGIPAKYVLYGLRATESRLAAKGTGSTFAAISGKDLREHRLALAPEDQRENIVSSLEQHFTRLDTAVSALKSAQARLRRYRAAVLKAACEGRLVPTEAALAKKEGRSYEPAAVLLERILKECRAKEAKFREPMVPDYRNLPDLPEGWAWVTLSAIAEIKLGKMLSPKAHEDGLRRLPYLRNENVRWGTIDFQDVKIMGFKESELQRYRLEPGDLMVCEGGEPGRCAVYEGDAGEYMYQKALHRVRAYGFLTLPKYLQLCIQHLVAAGVAMARASETTIQHLPLEKMEVLPFPLAPLAEQRRIVAEVERLLSIIKEMDDAVGTNLARSSRLRQTILKKAFEGTLVKA